MFQATLVAALAVLLVQFATVDSKASIAERADELRNEYLRDVEDKSDGKPSSSDLKNEARKQMVREKGFFGTFFEDLKYVFLTPFKWAWGLVTLPFNFSKTGKYWWDYRQEVKAQEASS